MEYVRCLIYNRTYKNGSAPCDLNGVSEGNSTCPKCDYYSTHLRNLQQFRANSLLKECEITARIRPSGGLDVVECRQRNPSDGKAEVECFYMFTRETRSEFKDLLKEYDEGNIESLINCVESDVGNFIKAKRDPARCDVLKMEDIIKTLDQAKDILSGLSSRRHKVLCQPKHNYSYTFENPEDPLSGDLDEEVKANCEIKSKTVLKYLPGLIQDLRSATTMNRKRPGSPNADGDNLAFQIANWFKEFIGQPRPQGGPFPKIVRRCFEICEINRGNNHCSRAIRYALRKLSSSRLAPPKSVTKTHPKFFIIVT